MKDHVPPEVYFAQHLASNDPKIRNRSIKKLRSWLTFRSSGKIDLTEVDMLKLWKGLYYCMWMCDKPLNQENLADNISDLVHCFTKPKLCMLFIDTFFQSMAKEWHGIDRFRIEKFMFLIRKFIFQSFCVLSKHSWEPKLIMELLKVLKKHVINPASDTTPPDLKMHLMDVFLDELAKAGACELKPKRFLRFIRPYVVFLFECIDSLQLNAVVKNIFHPLIWQAFHDDDEDEEETVTFQVDFNLIADVLLQKVASKKNSVPARNQKIVYKLIAELRTAARGEFPFTNIESDDDNEDFELKKSDINRAARNLVEEDLKIRAERKARQLEMRSNRKRKLKNQEESDYADEELETNKSLTNLGEFTETEPMKKFRKRKPNKRVNAGKLKMKQKPVKKPRGKALKKRR